jgi:hypothetical protein
LSGNETYLCEYGKEVGFFEEYLNLFIDKIGKNIGKSKNQRDINFNIDELNKKKDIII